MFSSAVIVAPEGDFAEHTLTGRASGSTSILSAYPHTNAESPCSTNWACEERDDDTLAVLCYIDCAEESQATA